jgi:hypothetical protein
MCRVASVVPIAEGRDPALAPALRDSQAWGWSLRSPCRHEATKAAQRAGIEHAKPQAYLGRTPSYTRAQLDHVGALLGQEAVGIARIAAETGLTRQTAYRIKDDEAALVAWERS